MPSLDNGYHDVPPGKLAAVVTSLEMLAQPAPRPERAGAPWSLHRAGRSGAVWYRELYVRVGGPYLWWSRLRLSDAELEAHLRDPAIEIFVLRSNGRDEGLIELDFGEPGACELVYFGVAPPLIGTGAGRWLMNRAVQRAWARPIARFWVHTCTLDHHGAPAFYVRSGFRPFRRQVEIFDDPRGAGLLPAGFAPDEPRLG